MGSETKLITSDGESPTTISLVHSSGELVLTDADKDEFSEKMADEFTRRFVAAIEEDAERMNHE